jgi:hypothetical protein
MRDRIERDFREKVSDEVRLSYDKDRQALLSGSRQE